MPQDVLSALILFAFVASMTPGPNNMMLMASGVNYGFARSLPHMAGVSIGFSLMILLVGLGLAQVFDAYPVSYHVLRTLSVAYLLYLAYKIATAAGPDRASATGKPFTFVQAALFQWVNPKGWTMALTAITVYAGPENPQAIYWLVAVFAVLSLLSVSSWTLLGLQLRRLLSSPARLRAFNWVMAALLVASLYPVLLPAKAAIGASMVAS